MSKAWLSDPTSLLKRELRKSVASALGAVSVGEIERQSGIVTQKVLSAPWYADCRRLSVYVSTKGEIVTDHIIRQCLDDGKQVFIPQFIKGNPRMELLRVPSVSEFLLLPSTLWDIRQPADDCGWDKYAETGPLDVILMPGVAFTKDGQRLGHGMGFYDRFLADHECRFGRLPVMWGLSLREQIVDTVPLTPLDVIVDSVIVSDS